MIKSENLEKLKDFIRTSSFLKNGAFMTDLDGTALVETRGRVLIPDQMKEGVRALHEIGRPVIINTLRFPLSVMRTVGLDWYDIANAPIPTVLLNGAILGHITRAKIGILEYEELAAFPLAEAEIDKAIDTIEPMVQGGLDDLAVFYYPRDWIRGERIWAPTKARLPALRAKYISSSEIFTCPLDDLRDIVKRSEACAMFIVIRESDDKLMAYQHTSKKGFYTSAGVDKLSGAETIAKKLNISLTDSIGAGDAEFDNFLSLIGFSLCVGNSNLPFNGKYGSMRLQSSIELGEILIESMRAHSQSPNVQGQNVLTKSS